MSNSSPQHCTHERIEVGPIEVEYCTDSGELEWFDGGEPIDPEVAMARLFGRFDLVGSLPAIGAPSGVTLLYVPPTTRERSWLRRLPANSWLRAMSGMWISHDGEHLLLCPGDPLLARNLMRDTAPTPA